MTIEKPIGEPFNLEESLKFVPVTAPSYEPGYFQQNTNGGCLSSEEIRKILEHYNQDGVLKGIEISFVTDYPDGPSRFVDPYLSDLEYLIPDLKTKRMLPFITRIKEPERTNSPSRPVTKIYPSCLKGIEWGYRICSKT